MKQIFIIRHAQSESNARMSIRPNHLINITEKGKQQALELAQWLSEHIPSPTQVFVSPYIRTHQTAQPFLDSIQAQSQILNDLHEFNYLNFDKIQHLSFDELIRLSDQYWHNADIHYNDGESAESFQDFVQRVNHIRQFLHELDDGVYVIFGHGMWIGMLIWQLMVKDRQRILQMSEFRAFELAMRADNCEVFQLNIIQSQEMISKIRTLA